VIDSALLLKAPVPTFVFGFDHVRLRVPMMRLNTIFIKIRQSAAELSLSVFPKISQIVDPDPDPNADDFYLFSLI